jgi:hypothetical protein
MTRPIGNDLAERFIAALHAIEAEGATAVESMTALFTDTARLANPALAQTGQERTGREGARMFWNSYADAFHGASTEFGHVTFGEGVVGLFWTTDGGTAPGGGSLSYVGATLLEHDAAGAITGFRGYYDTQALKATAGGRASGE